MFLFLCLSVSWTFKNVFPLPNRRKRWPACLQHTSHQGSPTASPPPWNLPALQIGYLLHRLPQEAPTSTHSTYHSQTIVIPCRLVCLHSKFLRAQTESYFQGNSTIKQTMSNRKSAQLKIFEWMQKWVSAIAQANINLEVKQCGQKNVTCHSSTQRMLQPPHQPPLMLHLRGT